MHEYGITESIVRISCEEAEKNGAKRVTEIRLKIGELSGLVPESLQIYFDMISEGTIAAGAKLVVEKIPIRFKCKECDAETGIANQGSAKCPSCNSSEMTIISGHEYMIDSLEVE